MSNELRKNIALFFYNADYPQSYTKEEVERYEKDVDYLMSLFEKELQEALDRQEDHFASILADLKSKIEFVKSQINVGYPRDKIIKYINKEILSKF